MRYLVRGILSILAGILIGLFVLSCLMAEEYIVCGFIVAAVLVFAVQSPLDYIVNKIFGKKILKGK